MNSSKSSIFLLLQVALVCHVCGTLTSTVTLESIVLTDVQQEGNVNTRTHVRVAFGLVHVDVGDRYKIHRNTDSSDIQDEVHSLVTVQCGDKVYTSEYSQAVQGNDQYQHVLPLVRPSVSKKLPLQSLLSTIYGSNQDSTVQSFAIPLRVTALGVDKKPSVLYNSGLTSRAFSKQVLEEKCNVQFHVQQDKSTGYTRLAPEGSTPSMQEGSSVLRAATSPVLQTSIQSNVAQTQTQSTKTLHTMQNITNKDQPAQQSSHPTMFLELGVQAKGANYGKMAESLITAATGNIMQTVATAFMQQTLYFQALELPPILDGAFAHLVVNNFVASLQQPQNAIFPFSLTAAVQARLPALVADAVSKNVVQETTTRVVETVTELVQRNQMRIQPENVERTAVNNIVQGAGSDLVHILGLSLPAVLTPSILYTSTHDPQQDYYCYYCDKKHQYCQYCQKERDNTMRNAYYAQYYTGYYNQYYNNYYKPYSLHLVTEIDNLDHQERLQKMVDNTWKSKHTFVAEQPYFQREGEHVEFNHLSPPEGQVESGPAGQVAEHWG